MVNALDSGLSGPGSLGLVCRSNRLFLPHVVCVLLSLSTRGKRPRLIPWEIIDRIRILDIGLELA